MKLFFLSILMALVAISTPAVAQSEVEQQITKAFTSGDAKVLSSSFADKVELVLPDNENSFSRQQAEEVVRKFFMANKPQSFQLLHKGGNDASKYGIGNLKSNGLQYRVYYLLKKDGATYLISQLRVEKE